MSATKTQAQENGTAPNPLAEAMASEQAIAAEAQEIRGDALELDAELYLKLWPLLKRPIPQAFIVTTAAVKGKPYPSTGVKSLQVLIDRMNNVLTPLWWWYSVEYLGEGAEAGTLAEVTVYVGTRGHPEKPGHVLTMATSRGGVNQASTIGNRYKGSETNAAKRAFAQVGPGHEVYLGATDHDPDTDADAAKQQERSAESKPPNVETIAADQVARLMETFQGVATKDDADAAKLKKDLKVKLGSIGVSASTVGQGLAKLTPGQAKEIDGWLAGEIDKKGHVIPEGCELVELPNGSRLFYKDADHSYWRCKEDGARGKRLTGVSTVSAPMDWKPDALMRWASKLTLEGVVRAFAGQEVPPDPHTLTTRLHDLDLDWESVRDEAATGGTNIHAEVLHALAAGEDVPDLDSLPPEQRGKGQAVMKWWVDHDPTVLQAEQIVLSETHGFAGRFDLRCEIDGITHMVDLKTGGFIPNKAHAQVAGYDLGAIESGIGPSTCLVIVQAAEDGTYRQIPVHATHEDFLAAVAVYRAAGRIGGAARKDRVAA